MSERDPLQATHVHADRLMVGVLWCLAILSFALAPLHDTWVWALNIAIPAAVVPTFMAYALPGSLATRLTVAAMLMVFCALNIHQSYGMIELHFGIFVCLAFLLCYRDWRPIAFAAVVTAVHHLAFNHFQELGYGVMCFTTDRHRHRLRSCRLRRGRNCGAFVSGDHAACRRNPGRGAATAW